MRVTISSSVVLHGEVLRPHPTSLPLRILSGDTDAWYIYFYPWPYLLILDQIIHNELDQVTIRRNEN